MKYMFVNDSHYVLKKYGILYILFLSIIISFALFLKFVVKLDFTSSSTLDLFLFNIGIKHSNFSVFEFMIYIFNIGFYTFFAIDIFLKDIYLGKSNIFLRISPLKWMSYKILIIVIYTTLFFVIQCILLYFLYSVFGFKIIYENIFKIIFFGLFLKILLEFINIIFLLIFKKESFILVTILYTLPWFIFIDYYVKIMSIFFIDIYLNNSLFKALLIMFAIILIVLLIFKLCKKKLIIQFEGSIL